MDLNPQRVRTAEFKTTKRGLDPEEVRTFLTDVADALESAQNQSTAMEARARAAVARLQELSDDTGSQTSAASDDSSLATTEQAETISRTLLLAQRTADTTIAQAEAESQRLISAATEEATATLDSTREMAAQLMDEAREEARKVGEAERFALASEVDSLKARRDFLESDVDHLEQFLAAQRERLRDAAGSMVELADRVAGGLGEARRPLLSAADDEDEPIATEAAAEPVADTAGDAAASADDTINDVTIADDTIEEMLPEDDDVEIGDFPADDIDAASDDAVAGFSLEEITGEDRRPEDDNVQFSFDDRH